MSGSTGQVLVACWFPELLHHLVLVKEPVMGPWGCPSLQVGVSRGGFLGVQIPPQPLLTCSLPDLSQALREERPPPQLLADLRGHHEEARWETTLGKGTDGPTPAGGKGGWKRIPFPSPSQLLKGGGGLQSSGGQRRAPTSGWSQREMGASRRWCSPVCYLPWARR